MEHGKLHRHECTIFGFLKSCVFKLDFVSCSIMMSTPFEGPEEAIEILTSEVEPVVSQFSPSYSLVSKFGLANTFEFMD